MLCNFDETVNHTDGSFTRSTCINEAQILLVSDLCYGLCYACAYKKVKAENIKLKKALSDCVIAHNVGNFTERQCAANRARDLLQGAE